MDLLSLSPQKIYNEYRQSMRKELGQNFIFDENINKKIIDAAGDLSDKTVAEIGPGPGGLTLEILRRNVRKLYIIEYDPHWCEVWRGLQQYSGGKLELIQGDAMKIDIIGLKPQKIISNLPYNISTQLLYKWFGNFPMFDELVLMFQKEVADRIIAKPKTKAYGQMSVISQWLSEIEKICDLPPDVFSPPPKVHSAVLRICPKKHVPNFDKFHDFVKLLTEVFSQRRKVVRKNIHNPLIFNELLKMGYSGNTRAEEISAEDYVRLLKILNLLRNGNKNKRG